MDGALRLTPSAEGLLIEVHVVPRASRSKIVGVHDGRLKVALDAPPVDGRANEALLSLFAGLLRIPLRRISLRRGESSRQKAVFLEGVTEHELRAAL
jgi:uncharacterized protein (TIGR00251 family)